MDNNNNQPFAALEAMLIKFAKDADQRRAEFNEMLKKSKEEDDRRNAEFDRRNAENDRRKAEFDEMFKKSKEEDEHRKTEFDRRSAELTAQLKQSSEDFDRRFAKVEQAQAENAALIKSQNQQIGGITKSQGLIAEEYFSNSVKEGKVVLFGQKFNIFAKRVPGLITPAEYDIVLSNCSSVCIIEIKYRVHDSDIPGVLAKVDSFRINNPHFKNHRIYLGIASLAFEDKVESEIIKQGIAVIKQIGDSIVINEGSLKVF